MIIAIVNKMEFLPSFKLFTHHLLPTVYLFHNGVREISSNRYIGVVHSTKHRDRFAGFNSDPSVVSVSVHIENFIRLHQATVAAILAAMLT